MNELCRPSSCCGYVCVVRQTDGFTPLYVASLNGHVEVVRVLVGAGAAVNQAAVWDDWGGCLCSGERDDVEACAYSILCMCGVGGGLRWRCSALSRSDMEQDVLVCVIASVWILWVRPCVCGCRQVGVPRHTPPVKMATWRW